MFLRSALARLIELSSRCVHCRLLHVLLRLFFFVEQAERQMGSCNQKGRL